MKYRQDDADTLHVQLHQESFVIRTQSDWTHRVTGRSVRVLRITQCIPQASERYTVTVIDWKDRQRSIGVVHFVTTYREDKEPRAATGTESKKSNETKLKKAFERGRLEAIVGQHATKAIVEVLTVASKSKGLEDSIARLVKERGSVREAIRAIVLETLDDFTRPGRDS